MDRALPFQNATASSSAVFTSLRPMIAASTASCSRLLSRSKLGPPANVQSAHDIHPFRTDRHRFFIGAGVGAQLLEVWIGDGLLRRRKGSGQLREFELVFVVGQELRELRRFARDTSRRPLRHREMEKPPAGRDAPTTAWAIAARRHARDQTRGASRSPCAPIWRVDRSQLSPKTACPSAVRRPCTRAKFSR